MSSTRSDDGFPATYESGPLMTAILLWLSLACSAGDGSLKLDERPAQPGEWGYRPDDGAACHDGGA